MAGHYQSRHAQKSSAGKKIAIIVICALIGAAVIGAGIFAWQRFFAQPNTAPTQETAAATQAVSEKPTEAPTQAPTEAGPAVKAQEKLDTMSDREKICQLFIVTPEVLTGEYGVTAAGDATKAALDTYPVGGIIYFSDNLVDIDQTKEMIANTQSFAKTPLFIAVDEEGGLVSRCAEKLGTTSFSDMYTYREQGAETATANAKTIATEIKAFGFNLDFAPVADVWTNPENTVIAERAYSDDFTEASTLVSAAVTGFKDGGVIPVLKHFPGHGDTLEDSHNGLATLNKTADELKSGELLPFKSGIQAGAGMVMIGHLVAPELDDKPATLSEVIVPTLLRQELGYDGVTVTDSMSMGAITQNYSYDEIVKGIFGADIDVILCPDDLDAYIEAMENALADGTITKEQLDKKVLRILTLKYQTGVIAQ